MVTVDGRCDVGDPVEVTATINAAAWMAGRSEILPVSIADVEKAVQSVGQVLGWYGRWVDSPGVAIERATVDPLLWALGWNTWFPWECQASFRTGEGDGSDWALFDREGHVAALVEFNRRRLRRGYDRLKLARNSRRVDAKVAVLTNGWQWEIYDLEMRHRRFNDRLVGRVVLGPEPADGSQEVAQALHWWLSKERLWGSAGPVQQ